MKDKILALLEQKYQGRRKDGLNRLASAIALQVSTEDEANAIAGKLTAESVDAFITEWRKEADAEISKANKTYEDGLRKKYDFAEKKTEPSPQQTEKKEGTIDAAAIQKIVSEAVAAATKPLLEKVSAFEAGNMAKTRLETLNGKLKDCKDETFKTKILKDFARMKFETDDEFTEYLTETENDVKTANQKLADNGLSLFNPPVVSDKKTGNEVSKEEIKSITDKLHI